MKGHTRVASRSVQGVDLGTAVGQEVAHGQSPEHIGDLGQGVHLGPKKDQEVGRGVHLELEAEDLGAGHTGGHAPGHRGLGGHRGHGVESDLAGKAK